MQSEEQYIINSSRGFANGLDGTVIFQKVRVIKNLTIREIVDKIRM